MRISIVGTGYVGLVTGACFAEMGHEVTCIDINEMKINQLTQGIIPIYEPGLEDIIRKNYQTGRLSFTSQYENAVKTSSCIFIAVGTPSAEDGSADLSYVKDVAHKLGQIIEEYKVIIIKSTVPIGTANLVKGIIREELKQRGLEKIVLDVVSNPEFLREGNAIQDFMYPDRVILGYENVQAGELVKEIYEPLIQKGTQLLIMDTISAELTKYATNAMLATRISFMNEIAKICEKTGADINAIKLGLGTDKRIGTHFLSAGIGYGGSCFPKDIRAMIHLSNKQGIEAKVLQAVEDVNREQKRKFTKEIFRRYGENLEKYTFTIWGLSFKPNTDDIREAAALEAIRTLRKAGAYIQAHDPLAINNAKKELGEEGICYFSDLYQSVTGSHALLLFTDWEIYKQVDIDKIKKEMRIPLLMDGRNIFDPGHMQKLGFIYHSIGRKNKDEA